MNITKLILTETPSKILSLICFSFAFSPPQKIQPHSALKNLHRQAQIKKAAGRQPFCFCVQPIWTRVTISANTKVRSIATMSTIAIVLIQSLSRPLLAIYCNLPSLVCTSEHVAVFPGFFGLAVAVAVVLAVAAREFIEEVLEAFPSAG